MSKKKPSETLSKEVQELLEKDNIEIRFKEGSDVYTKKRYLSIYEGYDLLGDLLSIRSYVQKRYSIGVELLELLLKLVSMKVFTRDEFIKAPRQFSYSRIKRLVDSGYVNVISKNSDAGQNIYVPSRKSYSIVKHFYQILAMEKKPSLHKSVNPMALASNNVKYDIKKIEVLKKLKEMPPKAHLRKLYED